MANVIKSKEDSMNKIETTIYPFWGLARIENMPLILFLGSTIKKCLFHNKTSTFFIKIMSCTGKQERF